jgi:hypothetical protein
MSRFENLTTGAVFSVDDSKDHRYTGDGYKRLGAAPEPVSTQVPEPNPNPNPEPTPAPVEEPPRNGPGSGREAWATHAAALGVETAEDATRDDIIAAVDAKTAESQP